MQTLAEQSHSFAEIQDKLVKGALDLFRGYGLSVEHSMGAASVQIDGPTVMAVVGFAAPSVRGALLIATTRGVVAALQPAEIRKAAPSEAFLRDILGEFCNMLMARVKNRLATRESTPLLSTPTTVFGENIVLPAPTSGMSAWHRFGSNAGAIYARLDTTFELEFSLPPDENVVSAAEGEMVMF